MRTGTLVERKACPSCRKAGHDSKGDNLAVYSDGHEWCYRCGYYKKAQVTIGAVKEKLTMKEASDSAIGCMALPDDVSPSLSDIAKSWLMKYELTPEELKSFWWSETEQQLIYPVFDVEGSLLLWQARNFGDKRREKYFTTGNVKDHMHVIGKEGPLILTEDIVSAIKVARQYQAMPLFGGFISKTQMLRIRDYALPATNELGIWLDHDKLQDGIKFKRRAQELGINAFVINSKQDPKCYSDREIQELVSYWKGTV